MTSVCLPWLAAVSLSLLTACSAVPSPAVSRDAAPPLPRVTDNDDACGASRVQDRVGQDFDAALGATLQARSGAATLRVMRPGEAHTLDYRAERLNVRLDAEGRIVALDCG